MIRTNRGMMKYYHYYFASSKEQTSFPEHEYNFTSGLVHPRGPHLIFFLSASRIFTRTVTKTGSILVGFIHLSPLPKSHFRRIRAVRNDPIINTNRVYRSTPCPIMERWSWGTMVLRAQSFSTPANFTSGLFKRPQERNGGSLSLSLSLSPSLPLSLSLSLHPYAATYFRAYADGGSHRGLEGVLVVQTRLRNISVTTRPALEFRFKRGSL